MSHGQYFITCFNLPLYLLLETSLSQLWINQRLTNSFTCCLQMVDGLYAIDYLDMILQLLQQYKRTKKNGIMEKEQC